MAYDIVHVEVLSDGSRIFWYAGPDADKPSSGLKVGSIYSATDNGKVYKATSSTTWVELGSGGATPWDPTTPTGSAPYGWWKTDAGVYVDAGSTLAVNADTVQQWNDHGGYGPNPGTATGGKRLT